MKCNHLALAIRGCFSKRGTAALLKSVSEASAARILEQRQSSAWLPGTGTGQGASTGHPYVPSGSLAGAGWLCMGLSATCLPISSGPAWKSCSPKLLLAGQGEEMGQLPSSSSSNPTHSHPAPQNDGTCACVYPEPSRWWNPLGIGHVRGILLNF